MKVFNRPDYHLSIEDKELILCELSIEDLALIFFFMKNEDKQKANIYHPSWGSWKKYSEIAELHNLKPELNRNVKAPSPPVAQTKPSPPVAQTKPSPPVAQTKPSPPVAQTKPSLIFLKNKIKDQHLIKLIIQNLLTTETYRITHIDFPLIQLEKNINFTGDDFFQITIEYDKYQFHLKARLENQTQKNILYLLNTKDLLYFSDFLSIQDNLFN